ncbi:MAG: class I SAM-dependent methyltransferase [Nitrospira sp.]|nr:class I SAM-dependent methyltransferase [Nitrospira sp.]
MINNIREAECAFCGGRSVRRLKTTSRQNILGEYRRMFDLSFSPEVLKENFSFNAIGTVECQICRTISYDARHVGTGDYYECLDRGLPWYYAPTRWEYPIVAELLGKERWHSFLEIGCGAGHFLRLARRHGAEGHGCEMNLRSVAVLRNEGFRIFTDLEQCSERYDAILMFQVLEHVVDPFAFLQAVRRNLKPGGVLVVSTPVRPSCAALTANPLLLPPHHQWLPTLSAFNLLSARLGLHCECVLSEPPDAGHVTYALKKWCGRFPHAWRLNFVWNVAGKVILDLAARFGCEWTKVGHTAMAVLRETE